MFTALRRRRLQSKFQKSLASISHYITRCLVVLLNVYSQKFWFQPSVKKSHYRTAYSFWWARKLSHYNVQYLHHRPRTDSGDFDAKCGSLNHFHPVQLICCWSWSVDFQGLLWDFKRSSITGTKLIKKKNFKYTNVKIYMDACDILNWHIWL